MKKIFLCLLVVSSFLLSCSEDEEYTVIEYVNSEETTDAIEDEEEGSFVFVTPTIISVPESEQVSFEIPDDVQSYYEGVVFSSTPETSLYILQLLTDASFDNELSYIDRHDYLYDADEDMENTDNVVLIYNSDSRYWEEYQGNPNYSELTFNSEHVYPQSFLPGSDQEHLSARDLHNLRVCDADINSERSNSPFGEGSGDYGYVDDKWYPGDEWKGDVARIVMYMNMYYDEPFTDVGDLETFLKWNIEDPVSDFELQRNNVIEGAQGNRNPFIDNPYLATLIWGGDAAENKW